MQEITKITPTDYDVMETIKTRWSPRAFDDVPVSESEVKQLLEAGRWASSSYNQQPWRIIYGIKGDAVYDRILECLIPFNQDWAKNAQALLVTAYKKTNFDGDAYFHALHDLGLFMGNFVIQANHNGIAVHQMGGIDQEKAHKEFGFTSDFGIATAVAIGRYGGDPDQLSEDLKEQELEKMRERKKLEEFAFNGNFQSK
ncbi:nitroreductase family protein [Leeuwenhoekiella marinoflava]|uniref:Nitroreductase n=2 Tax=Leeuwenhoekiella marinoflava TaxID=988 RepID=A0A4Q0PCN9_9FLAO|nr:nitroreductase family protein [Leeuwenhoekiella marinoflava]RXG24136.1 nitroreductase [Leeuwenhoekiella marinoflava]SHF98665.1 Nitroreductase [Leeuwenhoekiella marinoflava DSM 3653]